MLLPRVLACLAVVGVAVQPTSGSNILMVSAIGTKSHSIFLGEMVSVLSERGHTMTVVTAYEISPHPNVTQIVLPEVRPESYLGNSFSLTEMSSLLRLVQLATTLCSDALAAPAVQALDISQFDLVMTGVYSHECFLSLIDKTDIPLVLVVPNMLRSFLERQMGVVGFPSFVPARGLRETHPMTFVGRLKSVLLSSAVDFGLRNLIIPLNERECRRRGLCPPDMTPLLDLQRRASLILINSVRSLERPPRPYPPSVVPVGGINCRPALPLPPDLMKWADESGEDGFIYFSLGTAVMASDISAEHLALLVEVFRSLPQRVLWKWDGEALENTPPNVRLAKWLPQQDVLGHPRCRLFISHGGLLGTLEASYHAVPMLGMPVFADQHSNVFNAVSEGWADVVDWSQLTEELLSDKITQLLSHDRYREAAALRSSVMRDQPQSPREVLAYWTEYVIRHQGAHHLRSPVLDMAWYQLYNVDVWLTLGSLLLLGIYCCCSVVRALVSCCFTSKGSKIKIKTKVK